MISLLRHNQTVQREEDGAIEFCKIKFHLRNQFSQISCWSDERWKVCLAAGGGSKRRYQYCSDNSRTILYFRALQGHSRRNLIDPLLQDNVTIQRGLFHHIYHIGCAFNLHSIINNGLIPGGQNSSRRQTVFFLPIDPRDKDHEDPEHIGFSVPRRARYLHSAWKKHQDAVFWVDIDLVIKKGLKFYQTRSNAIILQGTLPAYCIPEVVKLKTGEVLYDKSYMSPRPPPKISLRHDQDNPEVYHEIKTFNTDNETIRERIEEDMDFKIPGLPHSTVKQLQSASVRELIQKIENHPNRHALQRDRQQSLSFNPFSQESKEMIHEVGNVELCELLDTEPKTQCKVCLSYWDVGIVYCTCGHFLRNGTEENKKFVQYTMDLLSIPNYYKKKGRPHGHRYGKKPGDQEYHIANSLKKKCKKEVLFGYPRPVHTRREVPQEHV